MWSSRNCSVLLVENRFLLLENITKLNFVSFGELFSSLQSMLFSSLVKQYTIFFYSNSKNLYKTQEEFGIIPKIAQIYRVAKYC